MANSNQNNLEQTTSAITQVEEIARTIWLAGLGVVSKGRELVTGKFDESYDQANKVLSQLISSGEKIEADLQSKLGQSQKLETKVNELRDKFGLDRSNKEQQLVKLGEKLDKLSIAISQLADKQAAANKTASVKKVTSAVSTKNTNSPASTAKTTTPKTAATKTTTATKTTAAKVTTATKTAANTKTTAAAKKPTTKTTRATKSGQTSRNVATTKSTTAAVKASKVARPKATESNAQESTDSKVTSNQ